MLNKMLYRYRYQQRRSVCKIGGVNPFHSLPFFPVLLSPLFTSHPWVSATKSSYNGSGECFELPQRVLRVVVLFQLNTMPLVTKSTCLHLFLSKLFWIYIVRIVLRELMTTLCVLPLRDMPWEDLVKSVGDGLVGHQDTSGSPDYVHWTDII